MPFMVRNGEDDFDTLKMVNAMESAGAVVVSITTNGTAMHPGALSPHQRFTVWARVKNNEHINIIDDAIDKERYGQEK